MVGKRRERQCYSYGTHHGDDNSNMVKEGWRTLSSHNNGKCNKISKGSVSAAITIKSVIPRFSVFVASLAPFFSCL